MQEEKDSKNLLQNHWKITPGVDLETSQHKLEPFTLPARRQFNIEAEELNKAIPSN